MCTQLDRPSEIYETSQDLLSFHGSMSWDGNEKFLHSPLQCSWLWQRCLVTVGVENVMITSDYCASAPFCNQGRIEGTEVIENGSLVFLTLASH